MPRYHIHFATDPDDPVPPLTELPSIEADDPETANRQGPLPPVMTTLVGGGGYSAHVLGPTH